jgi:hypothetical protein
LGTNIIHIIKIIGHTINYIIHMTENIVVKYFFMYNNSKRNYYKLLFEQFEIIKRGVNMSIMYFFDKERLKDQEQKILSIVIQLSNKDEQNQELIAKILDFTRLTYWHTKCSKLFKDNEFIEKLEIIEIDHLYIYKLISKCNSFKTFKELLVFTNKFFWRIFSIIKKNDLILTVLEQLKKNKYHEDIITEYLRKNKNIIEYTQNDLQNSNINLKRDGFQQQREKNRKRFNRAIEDYRYIFKEILETQYTKMSEKNNFLLEVFSFNKYLQKELVTVIKKIQSI